jgi:hypothetical protein
MKLTDLSTEEAVNMIVTGVAKRIKYNYDAYHYVFHRGKLLPVKPLGWDEVWEFDAETVTPKYAIKTWHVRWNAYL